MNTIQAAYDEIRYPHYVHPLTDPGRLAAIGRILGLEPASPTAARVLDIGCGSATNLLAMAERLPDSTFVGIDFAANEIAAAQALTKQARLKNVAFEQADLLTWDPDGEQYDYIIAYGLFSWVPDEVKDRLFEVCRQCLAPHGIACISYMTYPGSKQPEALRDLLSLQTENCDTMAEKVTAAHRVLDFLGRACDHLPNQPHSAYLNELVRQIRHKEPHFLLHDDLGVERDPCYLLQFASWAAEHGLRYVGESEFHTMFLENLPPETAHELAHMGLGRLETEQMIDYVVNRSFRCSLIANVEVGETSLSARALFELSLRPQLYPLANGNNDPGEAIFTTASGIEVTLRSLPLVAFARSLAERPGSFTPFKEVLVASQNLADRAFTDEEVARLGEDIVSLVARRQVVLSAMPFEQDSEWPQRPHLTPLNRLFARRYSILATAFHEGIRLTRPQQLLCELLNGSRSVDELRKSSAGRELGSHLEPLLATLNSAGCLSNA